MEVPYGSSNKLSDILYENSRSTGHVYQHDFSLFLHSFLPHKSQHSSTRNLFDAINYSLNVYLYSWRGTTHARLVQKTFCLKIHFLSILDLAFTFSFFALTRDGQREMSFSHNFFGKPSKSSFLSIIDHIFVYWWGDYAHAACLFSIFMNEVPFKYDLLYFVRIWC